MNVSPDAPLEPPPSAPPASTGATVGAVGTEVHLPPFWTKNPRAWFSQIEARFALRRITSPLTMYLNVVSALPPDVADQVDDLLASPPAENPYQQLKEAILSCAECTEQSRIRQLLSGEELGDRKPSQLLHRMQQLLGGATDDQHPILRELFLQRLPQQVRMVLAGSEDLSLKAFAQLADRIIEYSSPSIAAVSHRTPHAPPSTDSSTRALQEQIARLSEAVESLRSDLTHRPRTLRSPSRGRRRSPSAQSDAQSQPNGLCWYHRKYGDKALKCTRPCSWTGNAEAGR
ncbi:uncharacterized protein LOC135373039 [Ornithodoros turicata]|uniref:uncharacterized protein LOC135373039 n=1 Tax=Ornithodoros turicata TaxID=34597 RepID=UPI003139BD5F